MSESADHPVTAARERHVIDTALPPVVDAVIRWHVGGDIPIETLAALRQIDLTELVPLNLAAAFQAAGLHPRVVRRNRFLRLVGRALSPRKRRSVREALTPLLVFAQDGGVVALLPSITRSGQWDVADATGEIRPISSLKALRLRLKQGHVRVMMIYPEMEPDQSGTREGKKGDGGFSDEKRHWFGDAIWQGRGQILQVLPASILINGFAIAMPLFIMAVYDRVVPNHAVETLWVLATGVAIVFAFEFLIRLLRGAFVDAAGKTIDGVLSERVFGHTLALDLRARPSSAGSFSSQARAYETVREFLSSATIVGLVDLPFALMMFGLIFWLAGPVGWVPVVASTAAISAILLTQPFLRRLSSQSYQRMINRHALFSETANGLESIKAANAAASLRSRMRQAVEESAKTDLRSKQFTHFGTSFTALCIHMTTVGVIIASVYQVAAGQMSMGAMIAVVMIVGRGMAPLNQVSNLLLRLQATISALRGLNRIMKLPREDDGVLLRRRIRHPEFTLSEVGFSYPDQPVPSLQDINLSLRAGERIGLIGKAGSGKTTLLRLLARHCTPTSGLLLIDGVDASQLSPDDVRRPLGYLPQDGTLFHGTVRDNILLAQAADSVARIRGNDERLISAADRAGVLEWTNRHPFGMNLPVGERGVLLSGGQRQAVLLARCLISDPDVLLLDEPTASMDLSAEKRFVETIRAWLEADSKRTLVLSTHKLSLLKLVDRVILLDQGRVKVDGTRERVIELLKGNRKSTSKDALRREAAEGDEAGATEEEGGGKEFAQRSGESIEPTNKTEPLEVSPNVLESSGTIGAINDDSVLPELKKKTGRAGRRRPKS